MVLSTIQTSISREKLCRRDFLPEKITLLQSKPLDAELQQKFYNPAVRLLDMLCNGNTGESKF